MIFLNAPPVIPSSGGAHFFLRQFEPRSGSRCEALPKAEPRTRARSDAPEGRESEDIAGAEAPAENKKRFPTMTLPTGAPPLAALKQWLAISTGGEDALLERLLTVAFETCSAFVGNALPGDWADVPPSLNEGILRFAAHLYRERDETKPVEPPTAVAALWRPYRELRL